MAQIACLVIDALNIFHNIRGNDLATWLVNPKLRRRLSVVKANDVGREVWNQILIMGRPIDTDGLLLVGDKLSQLCVSRLGCAKCPLLRLD